MCFCFLHIGLSHEVNLKFRPEKTGIISICLTLACSIFKSLFRFHLTCYRLCHDEDGWCQISINLFLLEAVRNFQSVEDGEGRASIGKQSRPVLNRFDRFLLIGPRTTSTNQHKFALRIEADCEYFRCGVQCFSRGFGGFERPKRSLNYSNGLSKRFKLALLPPPKYTKTLLYNHLSNGNGNGLLFHMTQPTSRSTIKAIACSKPTISEH